MDAITTGLTATVTLVAVILGGWLATRTQERSWRRDHTRRLRDIRLAAYSAYLTAFRQYVAFALLHSTHITVVPHPRAPDVQMPFFDENGQPYRERLEAAKTEIRLVAGTDAVVAATDLLLWHARRVAAGRASHPADGIPPEIFDDLWEAESRFIADARQDLGMGKVRLTSINDTLATVSGASLASDA